jgi:hypothetical protein
MTIQYCFESQSELRNTLQFDLQSPAGTLKLSDAGQHAISLHQLPMR